MTPRAFLAEIVEPNVAEFEADYASLRRAFNAVAAVDALAAHLYDWAVANAPAAVAGSADDTQYRAALASRSAQFRLLRDVAKAHKHVRLTRGNPLVTEAAQTDSRTIGWGEGSYGMGRWGGVQQVVVDTAPDEFTYVEGLVKDALAFLVDEMTALGV